MEIASAAVNAGLGHPKIDVMNFLNEVASKHPQAISFAPGRPREEHFNVRDAMDYVAPYLEYRRGRPTDADYDALGQYGRTNGIIGDLISTLLANDQSVRVHPDDIVVTVGCQEAMFQCLLALCSRPGDVALISEPAYIGISGAARLLGIDIVPVPLTEDGIDTQALERQCTELRREGRSPRLLYLSADFANPTGISLPAGNRSALLHATRSLELLIVEDDAYGYFSYDGCVSSPLKSLPGSDHVIYIGSFSKTIFPSLRVGFLVADQRVRHDDGTVVPLAREMSKIKSLVSVNTPQLNQAVVGGILVLNGHSLRAVVEPRRAAMERNRDAMLDALARHFPRDEAWSAGVGWNRPSGGFFISIRLPFVVTEADLLCSISEYGVIWTPMSFFSIDTETTREIRLAFSYVTEDEIGRGIAALAAFVKRRAAA